MNHIFLKRLLSGAILPAFGLAFAEPHEEGEKMAAEMPWEKIFDGETLFGWDGDPEIWRVEGGVIVGQTTAENPLGKNTFLVWQGGDVGNFDLKLQYKLEDGNSGIQYRSQISDDDWTLTGYQADFEAGDTYSGILYEENGRGILAQRGEQATIGEDGKPKVTGSVGKAEEIQAKIKKDDWNTYEISARGKHLVHKINGVVTMEFTDTENPDFRDRGLLGLQVHQGPPMKVQFKDVQIRRYPIEGKKKVVFMAGHRSHGYGEHEHRAGCLLLANQLNKHVADQLYAEVRLAKDWPENFSALEDADEIVFYCDGGKGHLANDHLKELDLKLKDGCGLACLHYGVETTKGEAGDHFLKWMGGYFEPNWSVNPHWKAEFKELPKHPITRGVKPFSIQDEWYFHMRFVPEMKGVTPILSAIAPDETMERPDGEHSGNPAVREMVKNKEAQHVAWAYERPEGGRGFGFTGGHFHDNWANEDFRKLVLNAITWTAGAEVPEGGVPSDEITEKDLEKNQDYPMK